MPALNDEPVFVAKASVTSSALSNVVPKPDAAPGCGKIARTREPLLGLFVERLGLPKSVVLGRFQHFQRLGLLPKSNLGRGRAAEYTVPDVLQLAVAFELITLHVQPEFIVRQVVENIAGIARGFAIATESDVDVFCAFKPKILPAKQISAQIFNMRSALNVGSPVIVVNLSDVLRGVAKWCDDQSKGHIYRVKRDIMGWVYDTKRPPPIPRNPKAE